MKVNRNTYLITFIGTDNKCYRTSILATCEDDAKDDVYDSFNVRRITSLMKAA